MVTNLQIRAEVKLLYTSTLDYEFYFFVGLDKGSTNHSQLRISDLMAFVLLQRIHSHSRVEDLKNMQQSQNAWAVVQWPPTLPLGSTSGSTALRLPQWFLSKWQHCSL